MNKRKNISSIEVTKEHWGKEADAWAIGRGVHWLEHMAVVERINKKASSDPSIDAYQYLVDFLRREGVGIPVSRCLTLGCGAGDLERRMAQINFCERHDVYDVADEAIRKAKDQAQKANLSHIYYEIVDINNIVLQPDTYDVVFGVSAVHHFEELEHIFSEVRKALKPNGIFFLNEYVGPTKFQWTNKQLDITNHLLDILPEKYRKSVTIDGQMKGHVGAPTIQQVAESVFEPAEVDLSVKGPFAC